jgi:predicted GNAT superfamily acetyltransferase
VIAAIQDLTPVAVDAPAEIGVPAEVDLWKQDVQRTQAAQARVRDEFTKWFARGYAATGVRREGNETAYLLAPWSDF